MTESPEESVQIIINIEDRPGLIEEAWGACGNCCDDWIADHAEWHPRRSPSRTSTVKWTEGLLSPQSLWQSDHEIEAKRLIVSPRLTWRPTRGRGYTSRS